MVKAIIMDIDGVIVGDKIGVNSPDPNVVVTKMLTEVRQKGIPICLCTAKPYFAILDIIKNSNLNNPHITEGGAVLIDPIDQNIVSKKIINSQIVEQIVKVLVANEVYTELYTIDDYYVQENQLSEITKKHKHILQKEPIVAETLAEIARVKEIVKIMPIVKDEDEINNLEKLFEPFKNNLTLNWGVHPVALPLQFGIITAQGISKEQGAIEIAKSLNLPLKDFLGVGDSTSDWQFIKLCGSGAAMGNASAELKKLVLSKGKNNSFIAPTVDENGILEVFKHFSVV